jgi:hypothetical protein
MKLLKPNLESESMRAHSRGLFSAEEHHEATYRTYADRHDALWMRVRLRANGGARGINSRSIGEMGTQL